MSKISELPQHDAAALTGKETVVAVKDGVLAQAAFADFVSAATRSQAALRTIDNVPLSLKELDALYQASFGRFAKGFAFTEELRGLVFGGARVDGLRVNAAAVSIAVAADLRLLANVPAAPDQGTDIPLQDWTVIPLADLDVTAGDSAGKNTFIPLAEGWNIDPDYSVIFKIEARDAGGNRVGIGAGRYEPGGENQDEIGYSYAVPASSSWQNTGKALAMQPFRLADRLKPVRVDSLGDFIEEAHASATGLTVSVDGYLNRDDSLIPFAQDVALDALPVSATGTVAAGDAEETQNLSGGALTLTFVSTTAALFTISENGHLPHAHISNLEVRRVSDNALLVEDVDYIVNRAAGAIGRRTSGTDVAVKATYDWSQIRYSLIVIDAETRAVSAINGTPRDRDVIEYLPQPASSSQIPLFQVRVESDVITDIIPVWDVVDGIRRALEPQHEELARWNRKCLRKTHRRLAAGTAFPLVGYGDSITALQRNTPGVTTPNHPEHDRAADRYLLYSYLPDTLDQYGINASGDNASLYDTGDGEGRVHTRIGWNWELLSALTERSDAVVTYYNLGAGGTRSDDAASQGLWSTRLSAATAQATGGLVVLAFGMNERGDAGTEANTIALINAFKAVDADVVVMGVPRPNAEAGVAYNNLEDWLFTNRALYRAARFAGAAFVSTLAYSTDANIGAAGCSPKDFAGADMTVHPGVHEFQRLHGPALIRAVLGE